MVSQIKTWSRDELILCLALYMERKQSYRDENHSRRVEYLRFKREHMPKTTDVVDVVTGVPKWVQTSMFAEIQQPSLFTPSHSNLDEIGYVAWREFHPVTRSAVSDIVGLSVILNKLNGSSSKFRTANCVSQKLCDFLSIDPAYEHWGVQSNATDVQLIWQEFSKDAERLERIARSIKSNTERIAVTEIDASETDGYEEEYPEGKLLFKLHTSRERSKELIKKKKRQALKEFGVLRCEACGFVFSQKYGLLGDNFIECHHTIPISTLPVDGKTHIKDLALVCSNCHRMLHRRGELLTVSELRSIILTEPDKRTR